METFSYNTEYCTIILTKNRINNFIVDSDTLVTNATKEYVYDLLIDSKKLVFSPLNSKEMVGLIKFLQDHI